VYKENWGWKGTLSSSSKNIGETDLKETNFILPIEFGDVV